MLRWSRRRAAAVAVTAVAVVHPLAAQAHAVDVRFDVGIPMRDGVRLSATVYRPRGVTARRPVILTMTPYVADSYHDRGRFFAAHGYVFAIVDVRGRGNSRGRFAPFERDGRDGHDAVQWLARQPWADGRVVMWGGSYAGFVQWAVAAERPPALRAIAPAAAVFPGHDWPFLGDIRFLSSTLWLAETAGRTANERWGGDDAYWLGKTAQLYADTLPFAAHARLAGLSDDARRLWERWLAHAPGDAWWAARTPTPAQYAAIDIPVLTITGTLDVDQPGALRYHAAHRRHASTVARGRHRLVIGPWDHAETRTPRGAAYGLRFGAASVWSIDSLLLGWYAHALDGTPLPSRIAAPVTYFVAPDGGWRGAESLHVIATDSLRYVLAGGDGRVGRRGWGALRSDARGAVPPTGADTLRWHAADPRAVARDLAAPPFSAIDTSRIATLDDDGLVLESAPLARTATIVGAPVVEIALLPSALQADVAIDLYALLPDGASVWLAGDQRRVRRPDTVRCTDPSASLSFAAFRWTARTLPAGTRLRFVLSHPNRALYEPNPGGAGAPHRQLASAAPATALVVCRGGRLAIPLAHAGPTDAR